MLMSDGVRNLLPEMNRRIEKPGEAKRCSVDLIPILDPRQAI